MCQWLIVLRITGGAIAAAIRVGPHYVYLALQVKVLNAGHIKVFNTTLQTKPAAIAFIEHELPVELYVFQRYGFKVKAHIYIGLATRRILHTGIKYPGFRIAEVEIPCDILSQCR